jgi:hypothetical protein
MTDNPTVWFVSLTAILSTVIGLVVWLVKWSEQRTGAVTDRYFSYLEQRATKDEERYSKQWELLDSQTKAIADQTTELKAMTLALGKCPVVSKQPSGFADERDVERHW